MAYSIDTVWVIQGKIKVILRDNSPSDKEANPLDVVLDVTVTDLLNIQRMKQDFTVE